MALVVVFGVALLVSALLSGLAARTVLSTSLLFLVGGALVGNGFLGLIHITPDSAIVSVTADLALSAVLLTDGMHVSLRANRRNPARALGLGMPPAFAFISPEAKASFESRTERPVAAWFGPKGFASVVYGLLVLPSGIPWADKAFTLVAVCVAFSIIAHGSTDVPIARAFDVDDPVGIPDGDDSGNSGVPHPLAGTGAT
ncbi:hypothetical protein [Streptomyces sp. NPDC096324]|uniref:hypothetical protein n=1 Tax=Streptomyces sp. NPDC096324 TaxID=3366085 RepID=UPI00381CEAB3